MKNRKAVIIIIVIVAIILLGVASWLLYKKFGKKDSTEDEDLDLAKDESNPPPSYTPSYGSGASFPIKKGMKGSEVEKIQLAINKKCSAGLVPDGDFGNKTKTALQSCYNVSEVSQALYTQMGFDLGGSPAAASTGFSRGNKVYLKGSSAGIYSVPEAAGQWVIGNVTKAVLKTNPFGTWVGKANSSFDKVLVAGYINNNNTPVILNPPKELFVRSSAISKTPY